MADTDAAERNRSPTRFAVILRTWAAKIKTSARVEKLSDLPQCDVTVCDVTPRQLLQLVGDRLSASYQRQLEKFRYGPGTFKVDYALGQSDSVESARSACGLPPCISVAAPRKSPPPRRQFARGEHAGAAVCVAGAA